MIIREVNENKKQFISLLLLADEQENMIDCYLEKGTMYVLEDGNVKAECVVTDEDNGILEIKNIAVDPQNQGQGYGKALIDFLVSKYADEYSILQVGTGDSPLTVPFYERTWSRVQVITDRNMLNRKTNRPSCFPNCRSCCKAWGFLSGGMAATTWKTVILPMNWNRWRTRRLTGGWMFILEAAACRCSSTTT